jgi:hypothetical protein
VGSVGELHRAALAGLAYQDAFFAWPPPAQERYVSLLRSADPAEAAAFLHWLRVATPMRYPALVGAAAFVAGRLARGEHGLSRQVIASVLRRADDPGHLLAYWAATYGPSLPKPVKRGVADAVTGLYDEPALLAYDNTGHHFELGFVRADLPRYGGIRTPRPLRFGEVIKLVHPRARDRAQGDLFRYALARRHGRVRTIPASLPLVRRWAGSSADAVAVPSAGFRGAVAEFSPVGPGESSADVSVDREVLLGPRRGEPSADSDAEHGALGGPVQKFGGVWQGEPEVRPAESFADSDAKREALGESTQEVGRVRQGESDVSPVESFADSEAHRGVLRGPMQEVGGVRQGELEARPAESFADSNAERGALRGPVQEVGGVRQARPVEQFADSDADREALLGPMQLIAGLRRSETEHVPPGQLLAQLRRAGSSPHAETVLASLPMANLVADPARRARLEALIPHLPLAALLAGLRRFDAAGIGFETAMAVAARIADPAEVRASGLGPLRFAAAWGGVLSRRWEPALAAGAQHSLRAVPRLGGRTLVVIEPRSDTRIVFGLALAQRCDAADVFVLGGGRFPLEPGESPLHGLVRWHSTDLRGTPAPFAGQDRVVHVTEQVTYEPDVPADVPLYAWETTRYSKFSPDPAFETGPRRGLFRGLVDPSFLAIPWWEEFVAIDESGG